MTLVRLIDYFREQPRILTQTVKSTGIWEDIQFTVAPVAKFDYLVALNCVPPGVTIRGERDRFWALIQEPPIRDKDWIIRRVQNFGRVFTQDMQLQGMPYVHSHGALPWFVKKSYDELSNTPPPEKSRTLSWITSNKTNHHGHRQRMNFLQRIRQEVNFDLWGHGFTPLNDKWDGLAPYRYALAIENYSGPHYWTEKIADCFLSWTMPLYYGCTNLDDYFPPESYIKIDINSPDVGEQINEIINSNLWQERRDALAHARDLVLNHHQLFPFITQQIHSEQANGAPHNTEMIKVTGRKLRRLPAPLYRLKKFVDNLYEGMTTRRLS